MFSDRVPGHCSMQPITVNGHTATPVARPYPHQVHWKIVRADGLEVHRVTSSASVLYSGSETYVFPADARGEVVGWGELAGSKHDTLNHDAVMVSHLESGALQEDER